MRLLFDQNVPAPLARLLSTHEVTPAHHIGWASLANGALLAAAEEAGFDVLVTTDKNVRYQQNFAGRRIGIVVLSTQNLDVLRTALAEVEAALQDAAHGAYRELILPRPPLRRRPPPGER